MKRTLYLSYDGMTDPLGQSQVIPYLAGLSAAGYAITLVSFEKAERQERQPHIQALLARHGIRWVPLSYTKRPPVLSTLWDLWRLYRLVSRLHTETPFSLVHCRSYLTALIGRKMQQAYGLPFLFDMRGFWADERVDGGLWPPAHPLYGLIYRFFKRKEVEWLTGADHVISLTHCAVDEIQSWSLPKKLSPITVIPCCVDTGLFAPPPSSTREQTRQELGIAPDALVMAYLGSVGTWYLLPEMMRFFALVQQAYPKAVFLFVTAEQAEGIRTEAQRCGVNPERLLIRSAHREQVPVLLAAADLSVFFIKPAFSKKASSPTKQGELMSMGIPVICNAGTGDTDRVVAQYQSGYAVPDCSDEALQEAVRQIPEVLALPRQPIVEGAHEFYGLEKGIRSYCSVYDRLTGTVR